MEFKRQSDKDDEMEEEGKTSKEKYKSVSNILMAIRDAPKRLILMALCGILILILSIPEIWKGWSGKEKPENAKNTKSIESTKSEAACEDETALYVQKMEEKLKSMLQNIEGIGRVSVMLTVKSTGEEVTEKNKPYSQENSKSSGSGREESTARLEMGDETIFTEDEKGSSVPFVVKHMYPEIEGVLVIMEGAGDSSLKTEIIEGIQVLFDLPVHKIKVIRMKTAD